jgi:hypothetical protein
MGNGTNYYLLIAGGAKKLSRVLMTPQGPCARIEYSFPAAKEEIQLSRSRTTCWPEGNEV